MTILAKSLVFLLGMSLCVQVLAALYGIIDLWYAFRSAYLKVARRLLIWSFAAMVVWRLLPEFLRSAFVWGMTAYVFVYVFIFGCYLLLFARNAKSIKMK